MLLQDKFWLWGHPEGCYNNHYGNTNVLHITPVECCYYLGIRNTFMNLLLRTNFGIAVSSRFGSVLVRKMLENLRHRVRIFLGQISRKT